MPANPARGEIDITIEGKPYVARLSIGGFSEVCALLEVNNFSEMEKVSQVAIHHIPRLLHIFLRNNHPELTLEQINDLFIQPTEVIAVFYKLIELNMPTDDDKGNDKKLDSASAGTLQTPSR